MQLKYLLFYSFILLAILSKSQQRTYEAYFGDSLVYQKDRFENFMQYQGSDLPLLARQSILGGGQGNYGGYYALCLDSAFEIQNYPYEYYNGNASSTAFVEQIDDFGLVSCFHSESGAGVTLKFYNRSNPNIAEIQFPWGYYRSTGAYIDSSAIYFLLGGCNPVYCYGLYDSTAYLVKVNTSNFAVDTLTQFYVDDPYLVYQDIAIDFENNQFKLIRDNYQSIEYRSLSDGFYSHQEALTLNMNFEELESYTWIEVVDLYNYEVKFLRNGIVLGKTIKVLSPSQFNPTLPAFVYANADSSFVAALTYNYVEGNITKRGVLLQKFDKDGAVIWSRKHTGSFRNVEVKGLVTSADGGYVIGGDAYMQIYSANYSDKNLHLYVGKTDSMGFINSSVFIPENNLPSIAIYPNPVLDILHIDTDEDLLGISIYNTNGIKVYENNFSIKENKQIKLNHLPVGVYLLKGYLKNGKSFSYKILKK